MYSHTTSLSFLNVRNGNQKLETFVHIKHLPYIHISSLHQFLHIVLRLSAYKYSLWPRKCLTLSLTKPNINVCWANPQYTHFRVVLFFLFTPEVETSRYMQYEYATTWENIEVKVSILRHCHFISLLRNTPSDFRPGVWSTGLWLLECKKRYREGWDFCKIYARIQESVFIRNILGCLCIVES